ncbi:MAG TPA: hypothetical protein VGJ82_17720, partial [Thermoanaerobaculia bacterium]
AQRSHPDSTQEEIALESAFKHCVWVLGERGGTLEIKIRDFLNECAGSKIYGADSSEPGHVIEIVVGERGDHPLFTFAAQGFPGWPDAAS